MQSEHIDPAATHAGPGLAERGPAAPQPTADDVAWLGRVLDVLRERSGVDFSGYQAATLGRRVRNRMIAAGARTFGDYLERLRSAPGEADALVATVTIKVSRFFRDPPTFEALRQALEARRAEDPGRRLRVWSAGCGRGEEPYGLAMLLDGLEPPADDAEVLGTDIDAAALEGAAEGCYPASALEGVDPVLRARYFEERAGARGPVFCVLPRLRTRVRFLRHDLAGGAGSPDGGRFDLVCCRNVLIYLQAPTQQRAQALLRGGLLPGALLCLGETEWLAPPLAVSFDVVDRRARLFRLREGASVGAGR